MPLMTLLTINGIWTATFGHVNPTLDTAVVQGYLITHRKMRILKGSGGTKVDLK